jgi:pyruvate/2-oxoglutarate dehydrogenase complex dihydrolipoamide dehydrogenase (E3) component
MPDFDIIVIGAGPAGEVLAGHTAAAGLSTAIVEERLVGGECGLYACMPSKALPHDPQNAVRGQARRYGRCFRQPKTCGARKYDSGRDLHSGSNSNAGMVRLRCSTRG